MSARQVWHAEQRQAAKRTVSSPLPNVDRQTVTSSGKIPLSVANGETKANDDDVSSSAEILSCVETGLEASDACDETEKCTLMDSNKSEGDSQVDQRPLTEVRNFRNLKLIQSCFIINGVQKVSRYMYTCVYSVTFSDRVRNTEEREGKSIERGYR